MRKLLSIALLLATALSLFTTEPVSAGQAKVDICHLKGNGSYNVISIANPAVDNHIAHGDTPLFAGVWSGDFLQPEYSSTPYPIELTAGTECAGVGEVFASVAYPTLGASCSGSWTIEAIDGNAFTITETVGGSCYNGCRFNFTVTSTGITGSGLSCPGVGSGTAEQWSFDLSPTAP